MAKGKIYLEDVKRLVVHDNDILVITVSDDWTNEQLQAVTDQLRTLFESAHIKSLIRRKSDADIKVVSHEG